MDCTICKRLSEAKGREIYADRHWVGMRPAGDRPGWVMLAVKRHAEGSWALSPEEAAGFGVAVQRISEAIRSQTQSSRVYLVGLGETVLHCHFLLIPRLEGLGEDIRTALRKWGEEADDPVAADALYQSLRSELSP